MIQFLLENVGYKYKSQRLANILTSHKAQNNENIRIHFPLKLIKQSMNFGYKRKIMSWALNVGRDEVEMRYAFLNWNISGIGINDKNITGKEVVLRKTRMMKKYITAQRMVYIRPVKNIYQAFDETEFSCSINTYIKCKVISYHSTKRKRERIMPPRKMFKCSSLSCRH